MPNDRSKVKIVLAAMIGHALEFFDFTIYAVFAIELGKAFFPTHSEFAQLLSSLGVLAVGFFMRPLGGILFGHIGDKHGRKIALTISVIGMAIATLLIAILPTYYQIGIAAPIMLVTLRLIQGVCVGGEGAGASIFVLEHLNNVKPGLIGGIVNSSLTIGILLALLTGLILNNFLAGWNNLWRYAFLIGGMVGLAGIYVRLKVKETPIFEGLRDRRKLLKFPIYQAFSSNLKNVILTVVIGGITGCSGYLVMTFIDIFYKSVLGYTAIESLKLAVYGNILLIIMLPLMGMLSDKVGYARTMCLGALLAIVSSTPIFIMMASSDTIAHYLAILLLCNIVAMIYAPLYPFILGLFTPEQRYSGIAFSLNLGIAIFGGTSSIFCLSLIRITELTYAPAFYWSLLNILFLATVIILRPKLLWRNQEKISFAHQVS